MERIETAQEIAAQVTEARRRLRQVRNAWHDAHRHPGLPEHCAVASCRLAQSAIDGIPGIFDLRSAEDGVNQQRPATSTEARRLATGAARGRMS